MPRIYEKVMIMNKEQLSETEWAEIKSRVILPLWKSTYKSMFESLKMDFDDFESMAGYEIAKALPNFDKTQSNICTYAFQIVNRKAKSELRNVGDRARRKALSKASSLNCTVSDNTEDELIDLLADKEKIEYNEINEKRVGHFINSLSNQQLRFLILKLLEFDTSDIPDMLHISKKTMNDILSGLRSRELSLILYRRTFQ